MAVLFDEERVFGVDWKRTPVVRENSLPSFLSYLFIAMRADANTIESFMVLSHAFWVDEC
jgi:hypothetical protein